MARRTGGCVAVSASTSARHPTTQTGERARCRPSNCGLAAIQTVPIRRPARSAAAGREQAPSGTVRVGDYRGEQVASRSEPATETSRQFGNKQTKQTRAQFSLGRELRGKGAERNGARSVWSAAHTELMGASRAHICNRLICYVTRSTSRAHFSRCSSRWS